MVIITVSDVSVNVSSSSTSHPLMEACFSLFDLIFSYDMEMDWRSQRITGDVGDLTCLSPPSISQCLFHSPSCSFYCSVLYFSVSQSISVQD